MSLALLFAFLVQRSNLGSHAFLSQGVTFLPHI